MTSEQAERRNDLISRQAVLDLLWKLLDNSEYDGDKIIATIDDVEKLVGLESGRMNSKDALKIIGDWISEETHKRKYNKAEVVKLSKALIHLKCMTEQQDNSWTPVSEGLPEIEGLYLVQTDSKYGGSDGKGAMDIDRFSLNEDGSGYWDYWPNSHSGKTQVIAWMPLPEPFLQNVRRDEGE